MLLSAATLGAAPCDISLEMDVSPRAPADGATLTYTVSYCDETGFPANVSSAFFGVTDAKFVPGSGSWTSCPSGNCSIDGDGNLSIGSFVVPANECVVFTFTLQLQPGLGGEQVCEQGSSTVESQSPPQIGFPCQKRTDDPATSGTTGDATCVTVEDSTPTCDIQARAEPTLLATCAGSGDSLSAASTTETGCPGGALLYQWRRNGMNIPGATGVEYPIPADEPAGGAQYTVLVTCEQLPACQDLSNEAQVTVFESSAELQAPTSACTGETVDVIVSGAVSCTIDCDNGQPPVNACSTQCTYDTAGSYEITAVADDGTCTSLKSSPIDIIDQPVACIDLPAELCEDEAAGPTVLVPGNCSATGLDYAWSTDTGTLDDPAAREPTLTLGDVVAVTPVTVGLEVSSPAGCGQPDQTSEVFDLLPTPVVDASADPPTACVDEEVQFTGTVSDAPGPWEYLWDFGDTTTSSDQNPLKSFAAAGTYNVVLTATDQSTGCSGLSSVVRVSVEVCAQDCVWRTLVGDRETLDPAAVFLTPRTAEDIGLQGAPLQCPVASPFVDAGVVGDGNEIGFYQVTGPLSVTVERVGTQLQDLELRF